MRISVLVLSIMFAVVCCTRDEDAQSRDRVGNGRLRIVMRWAGDDFAAQQDLAIRDHVAQHLVDSGTGQLVRTGTGAGWMDIVIEVQNKERARQEIVAIVKQIAPGFRLTIEAP
ncbi:MAG: hypothetical protein ACWGNK_07850 [Desulfobacterales bacterium]